MFVLRIAFRTVCVATIVRVALKFGGSIRKLRLTEHMRNLVYNKTLISLKVVARDFLGCLGLFMFLWVITAVLKNLS